VIGPDFERFGGLFPDHLLSTPLDHSGLTVLGFRRLFHEGMLKAETDLAHALSHRPNATLVLLTAAQPDRPRSQRNFARRRWRKGAFAADMGR
jgi:hypothetical protein